MALWLDDGFDTWPEIARAGSPAAGVYARCGAWMARNLTDGHIPAEIARMYSTPEWTQRLVEVGLWTIEEDGYYDTRYLELNPSAEQVTQRRKATLERVRRHRERNKHAGQETTVPVTPDATRYKRATNASRNALLTAPPALPTPLKGGQGRGRSRARDRSPVEKPAHCPDHHLELPCPSCRADQLVAGEIHGRSPPLAPARRRATG